MAGDHATYRRWTAAYVLGALSPAERAELEAHLATCAACREEVADFAAIPGLLARVEPAEVTSGVDEEVERTIAERARSEVSRLRQSRGRWRLAAAAAAVVAAVLAVWTVVSDDESPAGRAGDDATMLTIDQSLVGEVVVSTAPRAWGTEILLELRGLPERDGYQLWAIDTDGGWHVAATWGPTPSGDTRLTGSTAVAPTALDRVLVTSASRDDVLVSAVL